MEKAVVLLSGGLDSCTCMAVAKSKGYDVYPISFNYHQRHSIELEGAKKIATYYGVKKHLIIETNMEAIGGSALTDEKIEVPEGDVNRHSVPPTYVPARNLIFLSYAMGYAEVLGATHVYIGVNSVDYWAIRTAVQNSSRNSRPSPTTRRRRRLSRARRSRSRHRCRTSPRRTSSCSARSSARRSSSRTAATRAVKACGICDSCKLRLRGFAEAGVEDPIAYETREV